MKKLLILAALLLVPALASAQSDPEAQAFTNPSAEEKLPDGAVSCFDHYRFGSVQVEVDSATHATASGSTLTFAGRAVNENEYPIVDGAVYVKIFRKQTNPDLAQQNGHYLVDQFFAAERLDLPALGSRDITFEWQVPGWAVSGDYYAATHFVSARKFNLLGLTFADDVIGNTVDFTVKGAQEKSIFLAKNNITLNAVPTRLAGFPLRFSKDEPVQASATIVNETGRSQSVPVLWTLYRWDAVGEDHELATFREDVLVPANGSKRVSYTATDTQFPVYFLTVTAFDKDAKSILNMRFVREGVERPRLNFPAVTSFPLQAGQEATLFSCLHNSGAGASVAGSELELSVLTPEGKTVHSTKYAGEVSGAMMAVRSAFTPVETYDRFTLKATLTQGGVLVDEVAMEYDCASLGGCVDRSVAAATGQVIRELKENRIFLLIAAVCLACLGLLVYKLLHRSHIVKPKVKNIP